MARESRSQTYTKIIDASLQLFNEEGERNISTNHIAVHLGISPGNLYYHFANKDEIIVQLFKRYSSELLAYLSSVPLPGTVREAVDYMRGVYDVLWSYRFLFSDVNALLNRSAELLGEHNEFTSERIAPLLVKLLQQLQQSGLLMAVDEIGMRDLSVNMWVITKYGFDFDSSIHGRGRITEAAKMRCVYRALSLLRPYMVAEKVGEFDALMNELLAA